MRAQSVLLNNQTLDMRVYWSSKNKDTPPSITPSEFVYNLTTTAIVTVASVENTTFSYTN